MQRRKRDTLSGVTTPRAPSPRRLFTTCVVSCTLGVVSVAGAQAPATPAAAEGAAPAADPVAAGSTAPAAAAADAPAASPDVQAQVGLGTSKQAPDPAAVTPAQGDQAQPEAHESREVGEDDTYGHGLQVGLRGAFLGGYKMVFRYDQSPLCKEPDLAKPAKDQQKFCGFMGSPTLDLALSFAPLGSIEPFLWARFALDGESQTNTNALKVFGAGLRVYTMSDSRFKVFIEPAIGLAAESGAGNVDFTFPADGTYNPEYKSDLLFHLGIGPQYDFAKAFGIYLHGGMAVGVLRSLNATLEFGGGIQLRAP